MNASSRVVGGRYLLDRNATKWFVDNSIRYPMKSGGVFTCTSSGYQATSRPPTWPWYEAIICWCYSIHYLQVWHHRQAILKIPA